MLPPPRPYLGGGKGQSAYKRWELNRVQGPLYPPPPPTLRPSTKLYILRENRRPGLLFHDPLNVMGPWTTFMKLVHGQVQQVLCFDYPNTVKNAQSIKPETCLGLLVYLLVGT